jgi:hypothetical protein
MSIVPDMLRQFGGVPVIGGRFQSFWGNDVFFVDYDSGTAGAKGKAVDDACKYLQDAIDLAGANDTIYVRPRAPEAGGVSPYYSSDPGDIVPESTTNWTIPYTHYGLSLIGTGIGVGHTGAQRTNLQGASGATATDPVLTLNAPYCNIENIGLKNGDSTASLIYTKWANDSVTQAGMNSFYNVWFRNTKSSATFKGLHMDSGNYDSVIRCNFSSCDFGVYLESNNSETSSLVIRDCDFMALTAEVKCNIYSTGGAKRVLLTGLNMNHVLPTGGSPNLYVYFGATSTGLFSDSYLGAADTAVATNTTLNGILYSHVYVDDGEIMAAT